jgi:pyrimidine-nucleoside phosphorylase
LKKVVGDQLNYIPAEIIKKKRNGFPNDAKEIKFIIESYVAGDLPDYQMAAWLMAVFFKGMNKDETSLLTKQMLHSGRSLDFSHLTKLAVDKHSTGGVGDKTSMILAPIAAAAGVPVPMIAGRGLGHTGGTLDKLEAIPGFRIGLSLDEFCKQIETLGVAIIGQTAEICPADKKIYALRDVTGTVESLPLICASIMSKKLAEGIGGLVLDVKYGSGAFMKTLEQAEILADKLMEIGSAHGKRVATLLTNMDQPLGRFIGNSLEIGECISILRNTPFLGHQPSAFNDTRELSLELAGSMIWLSGCAANAEEGLRAAHKALESGRAWQIFEKMCELQGGNLAAIPYTKNTTNVLAPTSGFIYELQTESIGLAALSLGAGRAKASDPVDHTAGIEIHRKLGDKVSEGDILYTLYSNSPQSDRLFARAQETLLASTQISTQPPVLSSLITKRKVN